MGIMELDKAVTAYGWAVRDGDVVTSVSVDIKPSKKTENVINNKKKNLKVAIVGSNAFDALQVDHETVKFGPGEASPTRFKGQDYNRDGYSDLILTFVFDESGIVCGDTDASLTGRTYAGDFIEGGDTFSVKQCP